MIYHDEYIVESFSTTTKHNYYKWFPNKAKRSVGYHEFNKELGSCWIHVIFQFNDTILSLDVKLISFQTHFSPYHSMVFIFYNEAEFMNNYYDINSVINLYQTKYRWPFFVLDLICWSKARKNKKKSWNLCQKCYLFTNVQKLTEISI